MGDRPRRVSARKRRFLRAFSYNANLTAAAKAAGIARQTPYKWRDEDPEFAAAMEEAEQESIDRLEAHAFRLAYEGVQRVRHSAGKVVRNDDGTPYIETEYSEGMLALLLKARRPERYKERAVHEITGKGGGPVAVDVVFDLDLGDGGEEEPPTA